MDYIAFAFNTTGNSPRAGHRISALMAIRCNESGYEIDRLHIELGDGTDNSIKTATAASFATLDEFIEGALVVIHDSYAWKRFLRQEFKDHSIKRTVGVFAKTMDVTEWSQQTYPRKRKNLTSLLKRLELSVDCNVVGLERDALALAKIAPTVLKSLKGESHLTSSVATENARPNTQTEPQDPPQKSSVSNFKARMLLAWRVLLGTAPKES